MIEEEVRAQKRLETSYRRQKYFLYSFHVIFCTGMAYLAYFCSNRRNQSVSMYFTISFIAGQFILDTLWRNVWTFWTHPEIKVNYYMVFLQVGFWWSIAALLWISIHPYAQVLGEEYINYEFHMQRFMKAESDFYNVISMVELRGLFIDTLMAIWVVWTGIRYHMIATKANNGQVSDLVT